MNYACFEFDQNNKVASQSSGKQRQPPAIAASIGLYFCANQLHSRNDNNLGRVHRRCDGNHHVFFFRSIFCCLLDAASRIKNFVRNSIPFNEYIFITHHDNDDFLSISHRFPRRIILLVCLCVVYWIHSTQLTVTNRCTYQSALRQKVTSAADSIANRHRLIRGTNIPF